MKTPRFTKLCGAMQRRYEAHNDPAHDWLHIQRVLSTCQQIGAHLKADLATLLPAALLHDIVNIPKNHRDRAQASQQAAKEAALILSDFNYDADEIGRIGVIILEHSYSLGLKPSCVESAILQDADRLDAIGAIGLMRMVTCGAKLGSRYYNCEEPIPTKRPLDDRAFTIDHLWTKLFQLGEGFHTEMAKKEGEKRLAFMHLFVAQLTDELTPIDELHRL